MNTNGYHPIAPGDRLLTVAQVAKLCRLSVRRVSGWIERGRLPAFRSRDDARGRRQVRRSDLGKFLSEIGVVLEVLEAGGPTPPQLTQTEVCGSPLVPVAPRRTEDAPLRHRAVFSTGQVAKICGAAARTVSKWFDDGRLRGFRIPGSMDRRIPRAELIRFLKANNMPLVELGEVRHKVLLVSTDTHLLARLKELLPDSESHRLYVSPTAFEAGLAVHAIHPDAVIIDLGLGRSEGLAMARRLSGEEPRPRLVALACEDEGATGQLTEAGFDDVFRRPFDVAALGERLGHKAALEDSKR